MQLRAVQGDITRLSVDAIVNAANDALIPGGGVDGAINRAAGPHLGEAMRAIGGCPTGEARITPVRKSNSGDGASRKAKGFTAEERLAMKDRVRELKADKADGESEVLGKIAGMSERDRAMAERVHAIVRAAAPQLTSRLWCGMPAYAKDGNVVCLNAPEAIASALRA
jgi:uncharacterized Zn finger protein (UPF0148 family)